MKREEITELIEKGVRELHEALAGGKSDQLQKYLDVMARFPRYSFNNCMLIAIQDPECTMVQGFQAWKKLGRNVKKGETGIGIVAPLVYRKKDESSSTDENGGKAVFGFKVVHVFDVSQTEGDELPQFASMTGDPGENITAIESVIRAEGIELEYDFLPSGADGVSQKGKIIVRPDLQPAEHFSVLVHELSHERMHKKERRKTTTKTIRETEAEAVAHVVCRAVGIESTTHCADYIQLYHGDVDVLTESLGFIQKTAAWILDSIAASSQQEEVAA
jgi:antirestriction protein ArdC